MTTATLDPAAKAGVLAGYARALRHRDLRLMVTAFLVDVSASWAYQVVLIAYVYSRSHSVGWLTAMTIASMVTGVIASLPAGVIADRYDRRTVLLCSALLAAAISACIGVLFLATGPLWLLVVLRCLGTAATSPTRACSGAMLPEVATEEDLVAANGLFGMLESVVVVIGPVVGGIVTALGRPVDGVWVNLASYLVAAGIYLALKVRSRGSGEPGGNMVKEWIDGVSVMRSHRVAMVLTLFMLLDSIACNAAVLLTAPISVHVHGGSSGIGVLTAAGAFGGIVFAPLATKWSGYPKLSTIVFGCLLLECVPIFGNFLAPNIYLASAAQVLSGAGMVVVDVLAMTALQRDLPRDVLGRALATLDGLMLLTIVVGDAIVNLVYAVGGLGWALGVLAFALPAISAFGLPALRAGDKKGAEQLDHYGDRIALLGGLAIFDGATPSVLERLAAAAEERIVPDGARIIVEGDRADALWVLEEGELAVSHLHDGIEVELPALRATGYVGELGIINHARRSATVTASGECRLLRIEADEFLAALGNAPVSPMAMALAGARLNRTGAPVSVPEPRVPESWSGSALRGAGAGLVTEDDDADDSGAARRG